MIREKVLGALVLTAILAGCSSRIVRPNYPDPVVSRPLSGLSIIQGPSTDSSAQINVLIPRKNDFIFELSDSQGAIYPAKEIKNFWRDVSAWQTRSFIYEGLKKKTEYIFRVTDQSGRQIDRRRLRTLDLKQSRFTAAFASCMDDGYEKTQRNIWTELVSRNPDVIFFMGDNVYADKTIDFYKGPADPQTLYKRYVETRLKLKVFFMERLIPIVAVWDDHDYGINNGDRSYEYKKESLEHFKGFYSQYPIGKDYVKGPGAASRIDAFGHRFVLLDGRSFRSTPGTSPEEETHFGEDQEEWLFGELANKRKRSILVNGVPFFGGYHPKWESYEGLQPHSFKKFRDRLKKQSTRSLFFSGDGHLAEIMEINESELGYKTYEITTSGIHAKIFSRDWIKYPNSRQIARQDQYFNYAILSNRRKRSKGAYDLTVYGENRRVLFYKELRILP